MIIAGNGIYETCRDCHKLVKLNRWLFAGWHFCDLEARQRRERLEATVAAQMIQAQRNARAPHVREYLGIRD